MKKFLSMFLLTFFIYGNSSCTETTKILVERLIHTFAECHKVHPDIAAISICSPESTDGLIEQPDSLLCCKIMGPIEDQNFTIGLYQCK